MVLMDNKNQEAKNVSVRIPVGRDGAWQLPVRLRGPRGGQLHPDLRDRGPKTQT